MPVQSNDHFSRVADAYAAFRPRYPSELFDWLASVVPGRGQVWDVGTGNGQAALGLAPFFRRIIATDFSAGQIQAAESHPRIEYRVAPAENSGIDSQSVDLVTVAQALHWFDLAAFFAEARRVLVPGGVVAAWTYGVVHADEPEADRVLHHFYYQEIGPWWPENRKLVEDGYRTIAFPFAPLDPPRLDMTAHWSLTELLGYIGTWSAVSRCREATRTDPVSGLGSRLAVSWGNPQNRRLISWPLSLLAGRS
jgi:ubiquinone/menaquinone biosynthesis C-methylase UbiE